MAHTKRFVALIHKGRRGFGAMFPDFPGCVSAGRTVDETLSGAAEALRFHVEGMKQDGARVPPPRDLETIRDAEDWIDWKDAIVAYVPLLPPKGRVERINFTIEEGLLQAIDRAAKGAGLTRSAWIAEAAKTRLGV
jgi:predicted RNase H-like HicB family nuclease